MYFMGKLSVGSVGVCKKSQIKVRVHISQSAFRPVMAPSPPPISLSDLEAKYLNFSGDFFQEVPSLKYLPNHRILIVFQKSGSYVELRSRTIHFRRENDAHGVGIRWEFCGNIFYC